MNEGNRTTLLNGVALTATLYSFIGHTLRDKELNVQLRSLGAGTPQGAYTFYVSNDPAVESEYFTEQRTGTRIGSSTTGIWVPLTTPATVHGDSLTLAGGVNQNSDVAFTLGLGSYFRALYTRTGGGTASSLGYIYMAQR